MEDLKCLTTALFPISLFATSSANVRAQGTQPPNDQGQSGSSAAKKKPAADAPVPNPQPVSPPASIAPSPASNVPGPSLPRRQHLRQAHRAAAVRPRNQK